MAASSVKMEPNSTKTSSAALLDCGNDQRGFREKLLLKPKPSALQTVRVPRSSVLERLHSFLPQMAEANERLKRQMEGSAPERFDIENVEEEAQRVIEMDVALVELDGSDSSGSEEGGTEEEDWTEDSDSDSDDEGEVTESNIKLSRDKKRKAQIQILQETGE